MTVRARAQLVSVIVPVLNEETYLGEQLRALAGQSYDAAWEVLIVDNGCTDDSMAIARGWSDRLPSLRLVDASGRRSLNHAKNVGASAARGDLLAFCDADDVVTPGWLVALADAARHADIVGGPFDFEALNDPLLLVWRPDVPDTELPVAHDFLPYVSGGNSAVRTSVARELGWNEDFVFGSDDQEFCWRAQLASYRLSFVPEAVVQLRYRTTLKDLARQWHAYGKSGPLLYRHFRDSGMRRRDRGEVWATWRWLLVRVRRDLLGPPGRRGNWIRVASFNWGRVVGSFHSRVLFL